MPTDLHVVDGDLPNPRLPIIPGHEIVGVVDSIGEGVRDFVLGERVGVPWLGHTCGHCDYCRSGRENLCDAPLFTGYTRGGGFATHVVVDEAYAFSLVRFADPVATAPLLCAGLIGWRSLVAAGSARTIGIYGFGAKRDQAGLVRMQRQREPSKRARIASRKRRASASCSKPTTSRVAEGTCTPPPSQNRT